MNSDADGGYGFADGIPIEPIPPGSTVLVAGPSLSRAEDLARSMVVDGVAAGEAGLVISTNMTCDRLLDACRRTHPSLDASHVGVVDCSGQDVRGAELDARIKHISTQSDLTGIGMSFTALYESLYADATGGRIRTGLITLSSLSMYSDLRKLFQFAQTLSGRIDSADGLGVFALDPTMHDAKTVNTLSQVADGRIDVREPDPDADLDDDVDGELRVRGLPNQASGWQPFRLP